MREPILKIFPEPPGLPKDSKAYLAKVDETYVTDAYNSLSIEGYRVSAALIEKVRLVIGTRTSTKLIEKTETH